MKSGALKEKPLWYDVYEKYPPELEPNAERPVPPQEPIPELVYEEDFDRASLAQTSKNKLKKKNNKAESITAKVLQDLL